ncbi:hypothetical protein Aspvir_002312 [Aspergillus viridinutans]|uniref:Ankyrin repeat-containing domain protein n=1 Tax=Aspergillus viridinutans TaxID=75553 RepID=A0A9P3C642_ASPVI|nr:uncharacterized protein Aspvir_002312 [Aspergillus viridinutans]GIK06662.1 hypothetical protein Aspvir_002312 [Aspergillus viridinutans]
MSSTQLALFLTVDYLDWPGDTYRLSLVNKALYSLLQDPLYKRLLQPGSSRHNGTYLHFAAHENHLSLLQRLVRRGGNLQRLNDISRSPLHYAVGRKHKDICRWIAATDPATLEQRNGQGATTLLMAAKAREWDLCRVLLECGADVNAAGPSHGWTCLHYAAGEGTREMVELILNHGGDLGAVTKGGGTPLRMAVRCNNTDLIKVMVDYGADIHAVDDTGTSIVHWALEDGNLTNVQLLVELGASVRVKDARGHTPLHWAAQRGHVDICEWLLRYGGAQENVNAQCNGFLTPLYYAAKEGHREVCRVLQNHGGDFGGLFIMR